MLFLRQESERVLVSNAHLTLNHNGATSQFEGTRVFLNSPSSSTIPNQFSALG